MRSKKLLTWYKKQQTSNSRKELWLILWLSNQGPDFWINIILDESVRIFLDEIGIGICKLTKAGCLLQCEWEGPSNSLTVYKLGHQSSAFRLLLEFILSALLDPMLKRTGLGTSQLLWLCKLVPYNKSLYTHTHTCIHSHLLLVMFLWRILTNTELLIQESFLWMSSDIFPKLGRDSFSDICAKLTTTLALMLVVIWKELRDLFLGILTEDRRRNTRYLIA